MPLPPLAVVAAWAQRTACDTGTGTGTGTGTDRYGETVAPPAWEPPVLLAATGRVADRATGQAAP
ncbi:hypothetical protein ACFYO5_30170 [Streptomyces sp. NPDC006259]|uniref:hypothetical protein n=1 Tax=Streptomyces sp. NPDC006259 TaxID=3364740 RepID=UPI00369C2C1A